MQLDEAPGPTKAEIPPPAFPEPLPLPRPEPVEDPPLVAALRSYYNNQPVDALSHLNRFDKSSQDMLLVLLPMAVRFGERTIPQLSPQEASLLLAQLQSMAQPLRLRADLSLTKMVLCSSVENFGVYEPLAENVAFRPGDRVQVYVELQNASNRPDKNGFMTQFSSKFEIREYNGNVVWRNDFAGRTQADVSRSPRSDCFVAYAFALPESLKPGAYTLRLEVKDVATDRTAVKTLDFRVSTLAARPS